MNEGKMKSERDIKSENEKGSGFKKWRFGKDENEGSFVLKQ